MTESIIFASEALVEVDNTKYLVNFRISELTMTDKKRNLSATGKKLDIVGVVKEDTGEPTYCSSGMLSEIKRRVSNDLLS